jgi:hypothetical protein
MTLTPGGHLRLRLSSHRPLFAGELVPAVVGQDEVHEDEVLGLRVEAGNGHLHGWEHPSEKETKILKNLNNFTTFNSSAT